MTEPTFTGATEDVYGSLAQYLRVADRRQGSWPLKRYMAAILDQLGILRDIYERIDYLSPDEFGADRSPLELFTNLVLHPTVDLDNTDPGRWFMYAVSGTEQGAVVSDDTSIDQGRLWRVSFTEDDSGGGYVGGIPLTPGVLHVASMYVRPSKGVTIQAGADVGTTGGPLYGFAHGDPTDCPAGVWTRLNPVAFTAPANATTLTMTGYFDDWHDGDYIDYAAAQAELGAVLHVYRQYQGVASGETSELVTPETADDAWLPWLAQLVGVKLNLDLNREAKVDAVRFASAGWQGGTKSAVAAAAKSVLTGSKYAKVYDHSTEAGIGTGGEWDVLIVTRSTETPPYIYPGPGLYPGPGVLPGIGQQVLDAVIKQNAKPAGVVLHHLSYNATWADIAAAHPTWADWVGTWARIEESGL